MESTFPFNVYGSNISSLPQSVTSLPAYTRRPSPPPQHPLTEHVFDLSTTANRKSKPWATLRVFSMARTPKSLPTFLEGDKITGSVTLDLGSSGDHISCVRVMVRGEITTGVDSVDLVTFLELSTVLWSKESEDRDTPQNRRFSRSASGSGKLCGEHFWPFTLNLPREIVSSTSSEGNDIRSYPLPHSFLERKTSASIIYHLIVHISRGKLRNDNSLQTVIVYIPATRPDPPSPLRQLAYQENSPLMGPHIDPAGWYTLPPAKVYGKIFDSRSVEITCRLSLAKPLCYTRGSVIPLYLTLTSTDVQALDLLLSSRQALTVHLRRKIAFQEARTRAEVNVAWVKYERVDPFNDLGTAVWWTPPDVEANEDSDDAFPNKRSTRRLEGEILLAKNLKPTCVISHFSIQYTVVLLPFRAVGFVASSSSDRFNGPILEQPVEIATLYPKGPRPIPHSPPEYRPQTADSISAPSSSGVL